MLSANVLHLLHLCDPALPIGGFAHSAGLETYIQLGIINDKVSATEFVNQQLSQNIFYTDASLASLAFGACTNNNFETIRELDALCNAVKLPKEMRMASTKLAMRLLKIFAKKQNFVLSGSYKAAIIKQECFGHYCIAFGMLAFEMQINKEEALAAFYYNAATGFVTNAVKLIPLGQQDGQEILMSAFPMINNLVKNTMDPDKEMIGFCCTAFDIRCMQHEQLYSRLYMS